MRRHLLIGIALAGALWTNGQDVHFSQFFFNPQNLSAAEIGNFDASYRFNAIQKTQWRQVSQPYNSFSLSADGFIPLMPKEVALGINIMNDKAGDSRFNTFSLLLGGSYFYPLSASGVHAVRGGLQVGFSQIKIDQADLSFNNQYNGVVYDPNLPSGENFRRNNRWYLNVNPGLAYTYTYAIRKTITVGYAGHNLFSPKQSFFNDTGVELPYRSSFYTNATWKLSGKFEALPSLRFMNQATFNEFIIGSALRYILLHERSLYRSLFAGYYGRMGDSGIAMMGFELDEWRFAASYDINVSNLKTASRNRGGLEFSLQYLFNRKNTAAEFVHKHCPIFL